jgi:hypothetical protein
MGVVPEQSALAMHRTQLPDVASHTGVDPVHCDEFVAEHCLQAPEAWQAGADADITHSLSPPQARHARNDGSHTGVVPPQSALARQPTQTLVVVLQTGVAPEQLELDRHWTHVAFEVSQMGVVPLHSPMFVAEHALHAPLA